MAISKIYSSTSAYSMNQNSPPAKFKENFDKLGKALESGSISNAKDALTQIQKGFSANNGSGINPVSSDIASLGKTLNSGDIKAAQQEFTKIQDKLTQRRPAQAGANGGGNNAVGTSGALSTSQQASDKMISSQAQTAAQNMSGLVSISNPAYRNPVLGAIINTMV
jgi:hypothetical protein